MNLARCIIGISLGVLLLSVIGLAAEPAEVEKFVKARVDIGEMMTNYFQGGERFKEGQRPSPEQMKEMGADIHAKLGKLLAKHDLTLEEYKKRSPEVFADEAALQLAQRRHHREEEGAHRGRRVDRLGDADKVGASLLDPLGDI